MWIGNGFIDGHMKRKINFGIIELIFPFFKNI